MKKTCLVVSMLACAAIWLAGAARAECPAGIEGAKTQVTNTEKGVTVAITAEDPAVIKKIQDVAAKHFSLDAKGHCPKGCKCQRCAGHKKAECPKGCKCPKCAAKAKAAPPTGTK